MNQSYFLTRAVRCAAFLLLLAGANASAQTTAPAWRPVAPLPGPLAGHGMVLLPNGEVLIAGGIASDGSATRTSYLYSPASGTYRPTINQLITPRAWHALIAVTAAGTTRVFAIGGFNGSAGSYRAEATVEALEFDAAAGNWRWRGIGSLGTARGDARAAYDGKGAIVVTGGYEGSGGALRSGPRSSASDRIDVNALSVAPIAPMTNARAEHITARIIGDNDSLQILTAGGEQNPAATATQLLRGGLWDAIANPPLAYHTAGVGVGDPAGIARVFGGYDAAATPAATCEWYDVKRGWRNAPRMATARARFDATLIAGATDTAAAYLAVAGTGAGGALAGTEIFHLPDATFPNGSWTPFPTLVAAGSERRVAITGSNLPLVTGGHGTAGVPIANAELYQPLRANDIAFGDEEVGRLSDSTAVTIENTWLLPVRVRNFRMSGTAEFTWRGDTASFTIPAGGRRTVRAYFQPAIAGPRSGLLLFDVGPLTDTVRLSGRGIASVIGVINSPVDLGSHLLATSTGGCFYVLRNNGTDTATIDSIVLAPPGAFRLVSPLGRAAIAPGDSLRICVEFAPDSQGIDQATATIHIAARSFPLQVLGKGIRRYLTASPLTSDCDTVLFAPGVETSGFIGLQNPGDTVVHADVPTLKASANGLFRLANPALFPADIPPHGSISVEVIFSPQRESQETVVADFPNNGDTVARASLCFVARSRYLSVSQSMVDLGSLCAGDTATVTVTVENPGGYDSVAVTSATLEPAGALALSGFAARTLGPREYMTLVIRYTPSAAGPLAGTLTVGSSRGNVAIPVKGSALAAVQFTPQTGTLTIGDTAVIPVDVAGIAGTGGAAAASLTLEYDPHLLMPLGIVSLPGATAINPAASGITIDGGGRATLRLGWLGTIASDGAAFGLRCDVLRGDGTLALIALSGRSADGLCIARTASTLALQPPCTGSNGPIDAANAEFISAAPVPAKESIGITLVTNATDDIQLEMVDAFGTVVASLRVGNGYQRVRRFALPVNHIPNGVYAIRARTQGRIIAGGRVVIAR
ncbi:MAG TPA: choice-of-anchor D domain-containing protein [Candidatus Kapabacteria bacterium]|nr:choice-of-anchor D domain-containing protein [Candidatus Kapabacteria bacterium]